MRILRDEKGIALVTSLLLTMISLAIVMAVLYFIVQGMKVSAGQKTYRSSVEASYGGTEVLTAVIPQVFKGHSSAALASQFAAVSLDVGPCLGGKLVKATEQWPAACSSTPDPKDDYDTKMTLQGTAPLGNFDVYAKIIDSIPGTTDQSGFGEDELLTAAPVAGNSSGISPPSRPGIYRIEVQGERQTNPAERSQLSVLYAY